jgi:hypothetical protein
MLPHGIASQRHAQGWQHIVQVLYRLNGKQCSTSFEASLRPRNSGTRRRR